ncbi:alpha-ketoglutarate-dependent dioxygenase AlkB family protein [Sphingobacterium thermophilum]|uniref:Alpha-ketoglutarate-dependent dioxygenase AlkB n=1 Tax=Sphingobacterium thermophilum TaxID=768534 RepID=A0ABP8R349_9SPHI
MKLFELADPQKNLLPYDGEVNYYGTVLQNPQSYYERLMEEVAWQNDQTLIFGRLITTKRMVAWYGDEALEYTYSGMKKVASPWNTTLLELKRIVEHLTHETFNSCLLNLYHDGNEGMGWHSDAEKDLKENGTIASLSLGAERKFSFRHKQSKERIDLTLENGSLLLMRGTTQKYWLHQLPKSKKITRGRINLTFRTIVF